MMSKETTRNVFTEKEQVYGKRVFTKTNKVWISGIIADYFQFNHEVLGEKFYKTRVEVERLSGEKDFVPILISERLTDLNEFKKGTPIEVCGQLRTYNEHENGCAKLIVNLFVTVINKLEEVEDANIIYLDGYICKEPIYRKTPLGREITDLIVAVNRPYGKSDYIPCIAWGRNARYASSFSVGMNVQIYGRVQSREYFKASECENKIVYEVSIKSMEI